MSDPESVDDPGAVLAELSEHDEFAVDPDRWGAEVTSDRVTVDTPAGWLSFEVPATEDYGAEHERHEPDEDVYVDMWFLDGYTVVHTQDGPSDDATHTFEVHDQRPVERALELEAHGVPERRAQVVALREEGLTYSEIVDATGAEGPNHRGDVSTFLKKFNEQVHDARWLVENADVVDRGRPVTDTDGDG